MTWLHHLWLEEGLQNEQNKIAQVEIAAILNNRDTPEAQAAWLDEEPTLKPVKDELSEIEKIIADDKASRWWELRTIFGIADMEDDLLQTCLALRLDPSLSRLFAHLQNDGSKNYVTEYLVKRLFEHDRDRIWHGESPLRLWNLVIEYEMPAPEPAAYVIDPLIADWLLGTNPLDDRLVGKATIQIPLPPLANWPVQKGKSFFQRQLNAGSSKSPRLIISLQVCSRWL